MKCKRKRSINDLFEVYDCNLCKYNKKDEQFLIGSNYINIYYSNRDCLLFSEFEKLNNIKEKLFLKDCIINENIIFLWINDFKISMNYEIIEYLLLFNLDVHILTNWVKRRIKTTKKTSPKRLMGKLKFFRSKIVKKEEIQIPIKHK